MTFDLERARGLRDFLQDDCAEVGDVWGEMIAEIERLREDAKQYEIVIEARLELIDQQAARIKELEAALVEAKAAMKFCLDEGDEDEDYGPYHSLYAWKELPDREKDALREWCRKQLLAEGKIGPDAKSVNKGNQCQYCKKCGRDMRFEFSIRDEIWNKLPKTWKDRVLCIECFLEELNEVEPDQEIHFDDFNYMCILDPIEDTEWKGDRPKLLHPLFGGTLIDAKNPLAWQITEERKAALWHAIKVLKENDIMEEPEEHLWDEEVTVLQAMLTEAE